jgi:hypothetical protein
MRNANLLRNRLQPRGLFFLQKNKSFWYKTEPICHIKVILTKTQSPPNVSFRGILFCLKKNSKKINFFAIIFFPICHIINAMICMGSRHISLDEMEFGKLFAQAGPRTSTKAVALRTSRLGAVSYRRMIGG